jgi:hypothetical protein
MNITFDVAMAECIQHYVDRGYSREHATDYVSRTPQGIFWLYDIIQKEKELGDLATTVTLLNITKKGSDSDESST